MDSRPFPLRALTSCRLPDRHFLTRQTSHLRTPNLTTCTPPTNNNKTNEHNKHTLHSTKHPSADVRSCSSLVILPRGSHHPRTPSTSAPKSTCTSRPTLLQSLVAQNSPSLPETRPSLEASLARSPHPLRTSSLCDSASCPDAVISECFADGLSPQSCFGDSAVDGDWRSLRCALGSFRPFEPVRTLPPANPVKALHFLRILRLRNLRSSTHPDRHTPLITARSRTRSDNKIEEDIAI